MGTRKCMRHYTYTEWEMLKSHIGRHTFASTKNEPWYSRHALKIIVVAAVLAYLIYLSV